MQYKKLYQLLTLLSQPREGLNAQDCAKELDMSVSSFKMTLKEFNSVLQKNGAKIYGKSGRGNGYKLQILDQEVYKQFFEEKLPELSKKETSDYTNQEKRVFFLIRTLLSDNNYYKSEDLAEKLSISKSQFFKDLKVVKEELLKYHLEIESLPYYGMRVVGDEGNIRSCLSYFLAINQRNRFDYNDEKYKNSAFVKISRIIRRNIEGFDYSANAVIVEDISLQLLVAFYRIKANNEIIIDESLREEIPTYMEYKLANDIINDIMQEFNVPFHEDETLYLALQLNSKKLFTSKLSTNSASLLVERMIRRIFEEYGMDFSNDLELNMTLTQHITPLLKRIRNNTMLTNPMIQNVSSELLLAYDLAVCCARVINEDYYCQISEDEIAYLALHLQLALDKKKIERKKALLVTASKSTMYLYKFNIEQKFGDVLECLDVVDVTKLAKVDLSNYDVVFSTVQFYMPLNSQNAPTVITMDNFQAIRDLEKYKDALMKKERYDVKDYIKRELFFVDVEAKTPKEVIDYLCKEIGKVVALPDNFEEQILLREQITKTTYDGIIAYPHAESNQIKESFISIAVLKNPISWNNVKVQLVVLAGYAIESLQRKIFLSDTLSYFITTPYYGKALCQNPTYEALMKLLDSVYR